MALFNHLSADCLYEEEQDVLVLVVGAGRKVCVVDQSGQKVVPREIKKSNQTHNFISNLHQYLDKF